MKSFDDYIKDVESSSGIPLHEETIGILKIYYGYMSTAKFPRKVGKTKALDIMQMAEFEYYSDKFIDEYLEELKRDE